ncbi:MAG: SMI1/KNR4 family protein [Kofleriaceae bacterium]
MQPHLVDLIERVRRRLDEIERRCVVPGPASEPAIAAAEAELGASFPPSYRAFVGRYGALGLPADLAVVHDFCGLAAPDRATDVVHATLDARAANQLADRLIVVGKGADAAEWFCLDTGRATDDGECPVVLYDPATNEVDQVFYVDFGAMVREVLEFVEDTLRDDGAARD